MRSRAPLASPGLWAQGQAGALVKCVSEADVHIVFLTREGLMSPALQSSCS